MPTFDGGHCFLTALLPIDTADVVDRVGVKSSHVQMVRNALAVLPTAHQSEITPPIPCNSPFARCTKTHFARLAIVDDVIFNGRMPTLNVLGMSDLTVPRPVDRLPCPYLLFVADFDAPGGSVAELRDWLRNVWTKMSADLDPILVHCFRYSLAVKNADQFADYIVGCQLETTMPFNDYWPGSPPLKAISTVPLAGAIVGAFIAGGTAITAAVCALSELLHGIVAPPPVLALSVSLGLIELAGTYVAITAALLVGAAVAYPIVRFARSLWMGVAAAIVAWLAASEVLCALLHSWKLALPASWGHGFLFTVLGLTIAGAIPAIFAAYKCVMAKGTTPFPTAPNSDLPSVLKGLYLQSELIPFIAAMQGQDDRHLFDEFGAFLNRVQVNDVNSPTQPPGTVPSGSLQ